MMADSMMILRYDRWRITFLLLIGILSHQSCTDKDNYSSESINRPERKVIKVDVVPAALTQPAEQSNLPAPVISYLDPPIKIEKRANNKYAAVKEDISFSLINKLILDKDHPGFPATNDITATPTQAKLAANISAKIEVSKMNGQSLVVESSKSMGMHSISSLHQDQDGAIWGCSRCCGAWKYDGKQFYMYTEMTGLPDYSAVDMFIDSDGDVWFGMSTGLVKFDGQSFTNYSANAQVSYLKPTKITEDHYGSIWVGSQEGLYSINKEMNTISHFTQNNGLLNDEVNAIYTDDEGHLWVIYNKLGFSEITIDRANTDYTYSISNYKTDAISRFGFIQCIDQDAKGNIIFGSDRCLIQLDKDKAPNADLRQASAYIMDSIGTFFAYTMDSDIDGNMYLGCQYGLFRIDVNKKGNVSYFHSMANDKIPNTQVTAIMIDKQNYLWAGFSFSDPIKINLNAKFSAFREDYGISGLAREIVKDNTNNIWFSTTEGELYCIKNAGDPYGEYLLDYSATLKLESPAHFDAHQLILETDKYGNLWIGLGSELTKFEFQNEKNTPLRYQYNLSKSHKVTWITDIFVDDIGTLWVSDNSLPQDFDKDLRSTGGGVYNIIGNKVYKYQKEQGLLANDVYRINQDSKGNFWFNCLFRGLVKYEPKSNNGIGRWVHYNDETIQKSEFFISRHAFDGVLIKSHIGLIHLTSKIDSLGQEIFVYSNSVNELTSFPLHNCTSIGNNIWLSHEEGLQKITSQNSAIPNSKINIDSYTTLDGLPSCIASNTASLLGDDIYFEYNSQIVVVKEESKKSKRSISKVEITKVNIFEEEIDWKKGDVITLKNQYQLTSPNFDKLSAWYNIPEGLSLSHKDNYIGLQYQAVEINEPHKVQYRYYLSGYEDAWNRSTKENTVNYVNLPHGNYDFLVQARIGSGPWSIQSSYSFSIRPPWWHTWWAYVIYSLLIALLIYTLYGYFLKRNLADAEAKRLIELDQLKTRLYTNITHEFRTPLTVISGIASQIKEDPDQWLGSGVDMIQRNSNRLLSLVNQMLDLSKLESGKINLQYEQADVITYLKYIVESLHSYAESENIHIQFHSDEEEIVMDFDRVKLLQIMTNLISNAIKFTPSKGSILVVVKIEKNIKEDYLQIKVRDTGVGIPEDELNNIFNRFYQVDDSNTRSGEGSGIGLALVRELILMMAGKISVKSEVGDGTEFKVLIPITNLAKKSNHALPVIYNDPSDGKEKSIDTKSENLKKPQALLANQLNSKPEILIVEDNSDVVAYIVSCLQDDYNIMVGMNGHEGVEIAVESVPDLIISDVMMPIMDGFELCQRLKSDRLTSHIPIIMLTAKSDMDSKLDGLSKGADAYLAKPFHKEELLVRIKSLLVTRIKLQQYYLSKSLGEITSQNEEESIEADPIENEFILRIKNVLESNFDDPTFAGEKFQREMGMSKSQLLRKMNALIGMSPTRYIRFFRLERAKMLLITTNDKIAAVALDVGYEDSGYFSRLFKKEMGMTPVQYRSDRK